MLEKIFASLKPLGFNNVDNIDIYKTKEDTVDPIKNNIAKEIDINSLLYDKTVICPVCNNSFNMKVVKTYAPRISSKDSDFLIRYQNINPLLYEVWVCPFCGYAALKSKFPKLKSYEKNLIILKICNQWKGKKYPPIITEELAIERYKIALLNAIVTESRDSTKAYICLKIAWIYRLLQKTEEEQEFLVKALEGFLLAYENEITPFYGLDTYSLMYLIGELYRRTKDYDNAIIWYSRVITNRNANYRIKDKARDMKAIAKEAKDVELMKNSDYEHSKVKEV